MRRRLSFSGCKIQLFPSRSDIYSAKGACFIDGTDASSLRPYETKKELGLPTFYRMTI